MERSLLSTAAEGFMVSEHSANTGIGGSVVDRRRQQEFDVVDRRGKGWATTSVPDDSVIRAPDLHLRPKSLEPILTRVVDLKGDRSVFMPTDVLRRKFELLGLDLGASDIVCTTSDLNFEGKQVLFRDLSLPEDIKGDGRIRFLSLSDADPRNVILTIQTAVNGVNTFSTNENLDFRDVPRAYDYVDNEADLFDLLLRRFELFGDQNIIMPVGGPSGAGKSTLLRMAKDGAENFGRRTDVLDGDSHLVLERNEELKKVFANLLKQQFGHIYHDINFQDITQVASVLEQWLLNQSCDQDILVNRKYHRNEGGIIKPGKIHIPANVNTVFIDATDALSMARAFLNKYPNVPILPVVKVPANSFPDVYRCVLNALIRANLRDEARYGRAVADERLEARSKEYPHQIASLIPNLLYFVERGLIDPNLRPIVYAA